LATGAGSPDDKLVVAGKLLDLAERLLQRITIGQVVVGNQYKLSARPQSLRTLLKQSAPGKVIHRVIEVERRVTQNKVKALVQAY
jgi:hypothetical protein